MANCQMRKVRPIGRVSGGDRGGRRTDVTREPRPASGSTHAKAERISAAVSAIFGPRDAEIPPGALAAQHGSSSGDRRGIRSDILRSIAPLLNAHGYTLPGLAPQHGGTPAPSLITTHCPGYTTTAITTTERPAPAIEPARRPAGQQQQRPQQQQSQQQEDLLPPSSQHVERPVGPPGGMASSESSPHDTEARPALTRLPGRK